ncbi:MAG: AAA family ATPase, partial [Anaerolineales bacterium]|nr:AAA family ATPase [Anaerolineales bacterium]
MRIGDLSLTNFRNYRRFESRLPSGPLILVGRNAQGKTSLLEAIHYLAAANSPHAGSDRQLIHWLALREEPQPFMRIRAEVLLAGETRTVEVRLELQANGAERDQRLKKTVLVDGLKRRVRELSGVVNVVMFLPQDMVLVEGSPGDRRRYLDATISQVDSAYANSVREYAK